MKKQTWRSVFCVLSMVCFNSLLAYAPLAAQPNPGLVFERDFGTNGAAETKIDFASLGDQLSVEAKIYVTKYPTGPTPVEIAGIPGMFSLTLDAAGKLMAAVTMEEFSNTSRLTSQSTIPLHTAVRVAFTYDGQVRRQGIIIDGKLDAEREIVFYHRGRIKVPANPVLATISNAANGGIRLDTVRVWTQAQLFGNYWQLKAFLGVHALRYRKELLLAWTPSLVPPPVPAKFELTVTKPDGAAVVRRECSGQEAEKGVIIPIAQLATGDYHLRVAQTDAAGKSVLVVDQEWRYTLPDTSVIGFGPDNVMTVKGKPFFPLGMYHVRAPDFGTVAGHGFNFVIADSTDTLYYSARQQQDYVEAAGKFGMMTLMRGFTHINPDHPHHTLGKTELKNYQGHADVLAWYVDDEPKSFTSLARAHEFANREDPTHPTFVLHNQPPDFARVAVGGDIFSSDPYSFNVIPSSQIAEWTLASRHAVRDLKPVWTTLQLYTYTSNNPEVPAFSDLPSAAKLRAESYLSLATGARGLVYYAFDDTYYKTDRIRGVNLAKEFPREWASYKPVFQEIQSRANIWTAPLAKAEVKNQSPDVFVSERPYEVDGAWWVLAVNPSKSKPAEARFSLASGKIREVSDALGHPAPKLDKSSIQERIEPYGVRLYRITPAGK